MLPASSSKTGGQSMYNSLDHTAVIWLSYFGQSASGIVDVLLGHTSPSGRLPWTVPMNVSSDQLPSIDNYDMTAGNGRTHRYLNITAAPPLFPFAYGLSYGQIHVSLKSNVSTSPVALGDT